MNEILINISELKGILSRLNLAVDNTKLNPRSGWLELETISESTMSVKISSFGYYLEASVTISTDSYSSENKLHATVSADSFISLVSKLEDDYVKMTETETTLDLSTKTSGYTFPLIKELGKICEVERIDFNYAHCDRYTLTSEDVISIANTNAKGLTDAQFAKEIQKFIYVDNEGALTFTDNIYVNKFKKPIEIKDDSPAFKFLLSANQAKLLDVFSKYRDIELVVERDVDYSRSFKISFTTVPDKEISLILIVQSAEFTDRFPAIKIRNLAENKLETHAIIDKKTLDKALARLMIFDRKWDITVMNYSKLVFEENCVKLVSTKNKNFEVVPYKSYTNTVKHESIVRFIDLEKQLKAVTDTELDISYGETQAIVINSGNLCQIIPEIIERV